MPWHRWLSIGAKAYAIFACGHVCYKLGRVLRKQLQIRAMEKQTTIPQIHGHPFFGSILDLVANLHRVHDWRRDQMMLKNSHTVLFRSMLLDVRGADIMTMDPAVCKHILKTEHMTWNKPCGTTDWVFMLFDEWLGRGIFSVKHGDHEDGQMHLFQRKVASGIFTKSNFTELMRETFVRKGRALIEILDQTKAGEAVDMQSKFFAFTMDSIMRIFFGRETSTMQDVHDNFADSFDDAHRALLQYGFGSMPLLVLIGKLPWPFGGVWDTGGVLERLLRMVHPEGRKFDRAVATLTRESCALIAARRADPKLAESSDLLALFMNSQAADGSRLTDVKHTMMLRDVTCNFIIAGRDTTACTLTWMFYILATNPAVQEKLIQEIDETLGTDEPNLENTNASRMPYLNGVVYEALRLYPPVPFDPKTSTKADVLPDGTIVPKGVQIIFYPYLMGRDAQRYPEPEAVKPERWIPFKEPDPFEFPVFQAGPRICLGLRMAVFETKLLAAMLLQNFRFTLKSGQADKITYSLMITMSGTFCVLYAAYVLRSLACVRRLVECN